MVSTWRAHLALSSLVLSIAGCILASGCLSSQQETSARVPIFHKADEDIALANLQADLLAREPDTKIFLQAGPFKTTLHENLSLKINDRLTLVGDLLESAARTQLPLVIFVHGNHSRKEAHRLQARHLATWGQHALVLQVKNSAQWLQNGRDIAKLVDLLRQQQNLLPAAFDPDKIILVGHSFGGSAIVVAAGSGAVVSGLILLDPAVFNNAIQNYMAQIRTPVMLIGADAKVFRSRRRQRFFNRIPAAFGEISITGATHDDAQNPSMFSLYAFGVDPFTSKAKQEHFTAAIATTAFSFASHGNVEYAWRAFAKDLQRGTMKDARLRRMTPTLNNRIQR